METFRLPCPPAPLRKTPLLNFSDSEYHRLLDAAKDGYARTTSPLIRLFSPIPPLLPGRPFQLEVRFKDWQEAGKTGVLVPIDIAEMKAEVGGAQFTSENTKRLARELVVYIEEHQGLTMPAHLTPWYFDAPEEVEEHVSNYQGLMADTETNAITRLKAVCKPVRQFLNDGGVLRAGGPLSDIASALGLGDKRNRNRGAVLRM